MEGNKKRNLANTKFLLAESLGFEPKVGYQPTHDFQSCALDHSANSPSVWLLLNQRDLLYNHSRDLSTRKLKKK